MEELTAVVQEAEAAGTYVAAHAYTPPAIARALAAGVRSIEHGNWLDEDTAQLMAGALCCAMLSYAVLCVAGSGTASRERQASQTLEAILQPASSFDHKPVCNVLL